jgi:predicted flavoprotein YhiN
MPSRNVTVVGAGAAGLTAAIRAAEAGARVVLLNAHPKIGLKILMSGGTRCNVTHREVDARDFHGGSRPFVARVLRAFTPEETREWFESLGVRLKLEPTGKYFPESDDAQTVLDALIGAAERAGVDVRAGSRVVRLERGDGFRLGIQRVTQSAAFGSGAVAGRDARRWDLPAIEPEEWIDADAVVLASGGLSFPRTGSDGTGYALATALGHTLAPPAPALTPLTADDPLCAAAQGVTLEAELTLWVDARKQVTTRGSLLITHFGYSGPAALDLSRHWHRADGAERRVTVSVVPGADRATVLRDWIEATASEPRRTVRRHLRERVPDVVAQALAGEAGIDSTAAIAQVAKERRDALIPLLTERDLRVTGTLGYEKAEVTAGGVRLDEVDPSTLESRRAPGLYLCGEILDVEGRLGGFNFQWAWSSGTVAGRAAAK